MSDQDPTRPQQPVPDGPPPEPTEVVRTTETGPPRGSVPPGPPGSGGVSTGVAVAAALIVGLIGLVAGFLLFDGDDDAGDTDAVEDTVPDDAADPELQAERDELATQVEDLTAQVDDLQSQLDEVTQERDDLQAQLDEEGDSVETVPAPNVVDGSVDDAQDVADENGWILIERTVAPDGEDPGTVVAQYPDPEEPMIEGSVLVVDVAGEPSDE